MPERCGRRARTEAALDRVIAGDDDAQPAVRGKAVAVIDLIGARAHGRGHRDGLRAQWRVALRVCGRHEALVEECQLARTRETTSAGRPGASLRGEVEVQHRVDVGLAAALAARRVDIDDVGRAGVLLVASAAATGIGPFDWREARRPAPPRLVVRASGSGALLAGAARVPVELPGDVLLAGYRPFGRVAEEGAAELSVRVLVLETGGRRAALVLLEQLTLPAPLARSIEAHAREVAPCTVVVATHTHGGPGGYDRDLVAQAAGVGRWDDRVAWAIEQAADRALAEATRALSAAELASGELRLEGLSASRDRDESPIDDRLTTLRLTRPDGAPVATIIRFAAHPTLAPRASGPHGDWPGALMRGLEAEQQGVVFALQGAVGDVQARVSKEGGGRRDERYAAALAARIAEQPLHEVLAPIALGCAIAEVDLPPAELSTVVPRPLAPLAANVLDPFAPRTARVAALRLDDLVLLAVPAEPVRDAALLAEAELADRGLRGRVVSLAAGYLGYGITERDAAQRVYSSRMAWFGPALWPRLQEGLRVAVDAVAPTVEAP